MSKTPGKRSRVPRGQQPPRQPRASTGKPASGLPLPDLAIGLGLILSVFLVYFQVGDFAFTSLDDNLYVYENTHVLAGLTLGAVKWALTAVVASNWMPVTMLSHLLDVQLFHLQSGMHHMVNVVLHALSSVLLFALLHRATRARWASAFAACMFALHPLHVESVAWVAERKDVLSALFFLLALYCYVRYAERPALGRYLAVAGLFCLGLMSKPMLVTFPFTLLLLDFWPLRRFAWPKVLWEKLPLLGLSAGASIATYWIQHTTGAVVAVPRSMRLENALVSYITYIRQTIWPSRLAIFYPFAPSLRAWHAILAAAVLVALSALAIATWRTRPYLAVGWFWYVGTLVPVIGLVQAGWQAHADRYTYIPMIGLSIIVAWGAADIVKQWPRLRFSVVAAAAGCSIVWMALASREASYWRDSETLYEHAIEVTEGNWAIEYELANYLRGIPRRRLDAIPHYRAAVQIWPGYAEAHRNLGLLLVAMPGGQAEALVHLEAAQRIQPDPGLEAMIDGLRGTGR